MEYLYTTLPVPRDVFKVKAYTYICVYTNIFILQIPYTNLYLCIKSMKNKLAKNNMKVA